MNHRFADEALAAFIAAGRYFNQQIPRLGDDFVDAVETGIRPILARPHTWRIVEIDVRRFLINRFPYGIYFTVESDTVVIRAIKHLHRDPDYWQQRRTP